MACVRVLHLVADIRAAAVERRRRRGCAVEQHARRRHVRARPEQPDQRRGRLPNDRPHMFRGAASWEVPRIGFLVAGNVQFLSGKPWAATHQISLPQGDQRILLEPRGTRRLSSQTLLDLRVSKTFPVEPRTRRAAAGRAQRFQPAPPKRGWLPTTCTARTSGSRRSSSIRGA